MKFTHPKRAALLLLAALALLSQSCAGLVPRAARDGAAAKGGVETAGARRPITT